MSVRRVLANVVVSAVLLGGLSGCGGDEPDPGAKPKLPEPTSESPSPTVPSTVEEETAEEFIRRWIAVGDAMQVTGETSDYVEMTHRCQPCDDFVSAVEAVYANGGSAEFGGTEVLNIDRLGGHPPAFNVVKRLPETVIHHAGERGIERLPAGRSTIRVIVERRGGAWHIADYGVLTGSSD